MNRLTIAPRDHQDPTIFEVLLFKFALFCFTWLLTTITHAIGPYHIERTLPRFGQRGTSVEVTIQGAIIEEPREIIFFRPGIQAVQFEKLPDLPRRIGLAHGGFIKEQIKCKFEIEPSCPLGEHPFRIRFGAEISSLGTFHVTPFPVIDESKKAPDANNTLEKAFPVLPNVTIQGQLGSGSRGEIDLFRIPAKEGQQLSVEVDSVRISYNHYGDSEFDLAVRILDESGQELATNDDNPLHLQDPVVSLKLSYDGLAYVEVRRSVFAPRNTIYCLHISENRRPLVAYPPGGQAGSKQVITLLGDPTGDYEETIDIPEKIGRFEYFSGSPSSLLLRSSPYPNILENQTALETFVDKLPSVLNGIINQAGDTDVFRISAKKGDRLQVRVFAATLGSPIDPKIRIRSTDSKSKPGSIELEVDDALLTDHDIFGTSFRGGGGLKEVLDPSVIWEPTADGDYLLEIEDTSNSGGPTGIYRVEIVSPKNVIHTALVSRANDWMECPRTSSLAVPQGNRWTVNVSILPGQGNTYRGELNIIANGLPAGVRSVSPRVPSGAKLWPVQFVADQSALLKGALVTLEVVPIDSSHRLKSRSQQNIPFINHPGGDAWRTVRLNRFVLGVTEPAPFTIDVTPPSVPLVRGGELAILVKLTRREGFNQPVQFRCDWRPPGIGFPPTQVIPSGQNEAFLRISAQERAPLGILPIVVVASTVREDFSDYVGTGHVRVSSAIVNLTITEPYVELTSQPESIRRGQRKQFVWTVSHKRPFEGEARVKLIGLPKGVHLINPLPLLTKHLKEISFQVEATNEALLGRVAGLSCEVVVETEGQEILQRTGSGTLRIDPKL